MLSLSFIVGLTSCSEDNDIDQISQISQNKEVENIISNAKFDYRTKFEKFLEYHPFLKKPKWEKYKIIEKSDTCLVVSIPIISELKDTLNYLSRLNIVKRNDKVDYYIKMHSKQKNKAEYNKVILCTFSDTKMTTFSGTVNNDTFKYDGKETISLSFVSPSSRADNCFTAQCHIDGTGERPGWDVDGGVLPEVTITPDQGGSNGGNLGDWWLDDWFWPDYPDYGGGVIGGGGSSGSSEPDIIKNPSQIKEKRIPYNASSYPGYGNGLNCKGVSDKIMKQILGDNANIGSPNNIKQLWKEQNGKLEQVGNPDDIVKEIDRHIKAGHPIEVGVNHTINSGINNSDGTTDHFIVITGEGYSAERGMAYFNYIETGRFKQSAAGAVDPSLRLYYEPKTGRIYGEKYNRKSIYDVVQIRPNM